MTRTRFLALAGEPPALARACAARNWPAALPVGWAVLFEGESLLVLGRAETRAVPLVEGVVVGRLFDRSMGAAVDTARPGFANAVEDTKGRHLIERYWGSYCAVAQRGAGGHWILRDPSATLPVYVAETDGVHCYFSDLASAQELQVVGRDLDPSFLSQWLSFPFLRSDRTGLASVKEMPPGVLRLVEKGRLSTLPLWSP